MGELLYNGISLPERWPPQIMKPDSWDPMPVPYLMNPPGVIPIDVGRQLFVDNFLIEYTDLNRVFHRPVKFEANPILKPETEAEMSQFHCPVAAPFPDGCFYDPKDRIFKLWYMAGWFQGTALATSSDGIHWQRPELDVVRGTNLVLAPREDFYRDGVSVWLDHEAEDPTQRFKMYAFERQGKTGENLKNAGAFLLTSPDGVHWKWGGNIAKTRDNNTFFYNPFRKKWNFTIRRFGRAAPPWTENPWSSDPTVAKAGGTKRGRARTYWEGEDFQAALSDWEGAVFWLGADRLDTKRADYDIGRWPQIYKVDAVAYESLMLGMILVHYGPPNEVCAAGGFPKLTELQLAFSRDGFHWDRSCRETFIGARPHEKDSWERAYVHCAGGVCNVVGDNLHFYYAAFRGDESNRNPLSYWSGIYANGSTGLAILRRDGFASMEADENNEKKLLTRPLSFSGKHLFVNLDAPRGRLYAEACDLEGKPIEGFTRDNCIPISANSTKQLVSWKDGDSVESLVEKPIRLKFYMNNAKIYSFWVSKNRKGVSGGAIAAGGPGFSGYWDT